MSTNPSYLQSAADGRVKNYRDWGLPLGRRFRALKLWAVLRCYGRAGLQERIREAIRLAELFEGWVREEPGWELTAPRPFSLVCFRRDGSDGENEALLGRELDSRNFRRAVLAAGVVDESGEVRAEGRGRPARLYRSAGGHFAVDARERRAARQISSGDDPPS